MQLSIRLDKTTLDVHYFGVMCTKITNDKLFKEIKMINYL